MSRYANNIAQREEYYEFKPPTMLENKLKCSGTSLRYVNMYMVCLRELKCLTVNIPFSISDLLVSCLTITSWACLLMTDTLCISVNER